MSLFLFIKCIVFSSSDADKQTIVCFSLFYRQTLTKINILNFLINYKIFLFRCKRVIIVILSIVMVQQLTFVNRKYFFIISTIFKHLLQNLQKILKKCFLSAIYILLYVASSNLKMHNIVLTAVIGLRHNGQVYVSQIFFTHIFLPECLLFLPYFDRISLQSFLIKVYLLDPRI